MKTNAKKLTSLFVALFVVLGAIALILPLTQLHAQATPATAITLIDSEGNENTYNADASGTGWAWDAATGTLTLDNWSGKRICAANGDLHLHLIGTNTITLIDEYGSIGIETGWNMLYITAEEGGVLNVEGTLTNTFYAFNTPTTITNGTINVDVTTNYYSSSYAFYGTTMFDAENTEKEAVVNVTVENTYDGYNNLYGFGNGGLEIADRDNVTITVNATGGTEAYVTAIDGLAYENSAAKVTAVANNNGGDPKGRIAVEGLDEITMKKDGSIDLTGYVIDYYATPTTNPNTVTTTPADNKYVYCKNETIHNTYYVLSDVEGNPVEHTVFAYTETPAEGLVWCGDGVIELPSVYTEEYAEINILHGIRGGYDYNANYWKCEILEGTLPEGYTLYYSGGTISGSPTATCDAGTVKVRVKHSGLDYWDTADDLSIDVDIKYGAVLEKDKFITIDGGEPVEMRTNASGSGWSYDGETATLTLDGYDGGPIKAEKAFTILLKNENTITLSDSVLHDSKAYGIVAEYDDNTKDLYITAESGGKLNIVGDLTKGFSGIDAWFYLYGGTVNIDIASTLEDHYNDWGSAVANFLDFGEDDSIPAAFFATLRCTDPNSTGTLNCASNGGIDIEGRDNVTVGIYLYAASKETELLGCSNLRMEDSGANVTIVVDNGGGASDDCMAVGYINTMQLRPGGYVDLTGKVELQDRDISTNLNTTISVPAEGAYIKAKGEDNDFAICNLDGTLAERTVFTYTAEPTTLKWVGNGRVSIPAGAVGQNVDDIYLWSYLQGGHGDSWSYELIEGTLPAGVLLNYGYSYGVLRGTEFEETCEADVVKIRATDTKSGQSIEFEVPYGAVSENKPLTDIEFEQDTYITNVGDEFFVNVFITPSDASEWTLDADYDCGVKEIEYLENGQAVIYLRSTSYAGTYQIKVTHQKTGIFATATVHVRESIPEIYISSYQSEELGGFYWGETYTISGEGVTTKVIENATSYILIDPEWFGKTLQIVRHNADENCNSAAQYLEIPARPAAPNLTGVNAPKGNLTGKITGDFVDDLRYSKDGENWYYLYESTTLAPGTYTVYVKGNTSKEVFASEKKEIVIGYDALHAIDVPAIPAGLSGVYYSIELSYYVNGGYGAYTYAIEGEAPAWLTCDAYGSLWGYRQVGDATTITIRVTDTGDLEKGIEPESITFQVAVGAVADAGAHECVFDQKVVLPYYLKSSATCTTAELYYMSCVCGRFTYETDFENGDPLGHTFTRDYEDDEYLRSEGANCQEFDTYWYQCEVCDAVSDTLWFTSTYYCGEHVYSDTLSSIDEYYHAYCCTIEGCKEYINSASHTQGDAATENTPCTCTECDYVYQAAKGHTIIRVAARAATCTHAGNIEYYICTAGCGKMYVDEFGVEEIADPATVVIAALGHDYSEKIETASHYKTEAANCQVAHVYWFNCSRCTASARDDAGADDKYFTGTTFGAHQFDLENWGYQESDGHAHLCTVENCGAHDEVQTHNINWQYISDDTHHWKECSTCGYHAEEAEHDYDDACDIYCNTCNDSREAPHDFDMENWETSYQNHYHVCKLCGQMGYIDSHTLGEEKLYDDDEHWQECEVCGYAKNHQGHSFDNNCDTTCSDCDYVREITHQNDYLFEQKDPTCKDTGMKAHYLCNICNTYFDEEKNVVLESELIIPINPEAHEWGSWVTNGNGTHTRVCVHNEAHKENGDCSGGEATCTQKATCEKCNSAYGTIKDHTFGEKIERVDATCVATGMQAHYRCSTCDGYFNESMVERTQEQLTIAIDPNAHLYGSWISNGDGTHTHKCTRNVEHTETADCDGGEATCTQKAVCSDCEAEYGQFKAHSFGDPVAEVPATHTSTDLAAGMKAHYRCSECEGYFDSEKNPTTAGALVIPAPVHTFGEWITSDSEQHWKVCTCGLKNSVGDHEYDDESDMICNTCEYDRTIPHTHGDGELVTGQAATCTIDGWKDYYRCSCGHLFTEAACTNEIASLEEWKAGDGKIAASHTLGDLIAMVEANCTTTGKQAHRECSVCGTFFDEEGNVKTENELTIPVNNTHAYGSWTSNGDGTHSRVCANNAEHKENGTCEGGEATCTEKAVCTTCNTAYGQPNGHNYSEATCTAKATCSVCGDVTGDFVPHDYSEATCTAKATCSVCGDVTGDFAPHDYSEATCTAKATCSVCGDVTGDFAPHDYSEATCTAKATCSVCGDVKGEFAPHNYGELNNEVPAIHTESELVAGLRAHHHCEVCNSYFDVNKSPVEYEALIIPAPTHTYGNWVKDNDNHWKVCECGKKDAQGAHVYDDASDMICDTCEYDRTVPHEHGNGEKVLGQAATCTIDGWKDYYRCSCGHIYTDEACTNEITDLVAWKAGDGKIAASHTLGDLIAKVEANCTTTGKQAHYECSVCGVFFDEEGTVKAENELIIPTNQNHAYGEWTSNGDDTHSRVCANNAEHKESDNCAGGTATCTQKAICTTCGAEHGQLIAHTYSEATCTVKATCSVCGDVTGDFAPHTYSEATCTAKATCSVCGDVTGALAEHVDANEDGKCDACEHQMTPVIPEESTPAPEESTPADPEQPTTPEQPTPEKPEEPKKGLSGGAIAGIVVGSVAVAGTGGFAVWWFAIQKRTVAELGTVCKTVGRKIGDFFKGVFEKIKNLFTKK